MIAIVVALAIPAASLIHPTGTNSRPAEVKEALAGFVSPFSNGMAASLVLGQVSFTTRTTSVSPTNVSGPNSVAIDAAGDLWVADFNYNRVLEFPAPLTVGEPASVVLGQPNFYTDAPVTSSTGLNGTTALAIDASGDVWVSSFGACTVSEFVPPFSSGMAAHLVLGQTSFLGNGCNTTSKNFSSPNRLAFDAAGDLYVSDSESNRVLEFRPPFSTGMAASAVLGQSTMSGFASGTTAVNESFPIGVTVSATMLFVGDEGNQRILGYPLPISTGEAATVVLGQPSFTVTTGTGPNTTEDPTGLAVSPSGDLYATDYFQNRVVEFAPPFTPFEAPSRVLGQSTFAGLAPGTTRVNLSAPTGLAFAADGTLWVTDDFNNRLVGYVPSTFAASFTESGLPGGALWSVVQSGATFSGGTSTIVVPTDNGTHAWRIGQAPPGYHLTSASSGNDTVNGTAAAVPVTFAANSTASATTSLYEGLGVGAVVGLVVGAGAGILLGRRGKAGPSGATAWSGPGTGSSGSPPSTSSSPTSPPSRGAPPPGASQ